MEDLKLLGDFDTYGADPHDLRIVNDQLIVCNGGTDSNVAIIDLKTKKLLKKFEINEPHISLRHIEIIDDQNFLIASLSQDFVKPCGIYLLDTKKGFIQYKLPKEFEEALALRQFLSILYYDGFVLATCPAAHNVLAWKVTGEFVGAHGIMSANNLAYSSSYKGVVVGTGEAGAPAHLLQVIDQKLTLSPLDHLRDLSGSHATII